MDRAKLIDQAMQSTVEQKVKMTFGELFLFHMLLQDYGLPLVGDERFIPLMERNKKRLDSILEVWHERSEEPSNLRCPL